MFKIINKITNYKLIKQNINKKQPHDYLLDKIENLDLGQINYFAKKYSKELFKEISMGNLNNKILETSIKKSLKKQVINEYNLMILLGHSQGQEANHVQFPEIIAYGIEKKILNEDQINKIPFGPLDNKNNFPQKYGQKDLIHILRGKILNPVFYKPIHVIVTKNDDTYQHHCCYNH
jgi:hypothetical protein